MHDSPHRGVDFSPHEALASSLLRGPEMLHQHDAHRLSKNKRITELFFLWTMMNPCIMIAVDFCSLTIQIVDPEGSQISRVLTTVREKSGRTVQKESVSGKVAFCDLGMEPVTVTVGRESCNQITVRDVPIVWGGPYVLKITYDPQACIRRQLSGSCYVLLRVSDTNGQWVEKATVNFERPEFPSFETDLLGRSLLLVGVNGNLTGAIAASGFISKQFSLPCLTPGGRDEFIQLDRAKQ